MKSIFVKTFIIIIFCSVIAVLVNLFYHITLPNREIFVTIPQNVTGKEIANILVNNNLISNKKLFLFITDITGLTKKLQSGTYKFNKRMNYLQIISMLKRGKTYTIKITIPEGHTAEQIAEFIEQKGLGKQKIFLDIVRVNKLEGYLFPETYFFSPGVSEQIIIDKMTAEFKKRYIKKFIEQEKKLKFNTHQVVTLASIIEKEAQLPNERKLISGIFHNRLKKGWLLESCATVRYALKKYQNKLTYKDLRVNSSYSTYKYYGLPPAPICNPGVESIKATLYPEDTDLMFFFSEGKGTHQFSKYYNEHISKQKTQQGKNTLLNERK